MVCSKSYHSDIVFLALKNFILQKKKIEMQNVGYFNLRELNIKL